MKFKFAVLFTLLFAPMLLAIDGTEISLKGEVSISRDKIYLGDVAEITGPNAKQVEQLKMTYLKRSALPGYNLSITKASINSRIKKNYPDADITGPDRIVVSTLANVITDAQLAGTAEKYVKENMHWKPEDVTIQVKAVRPKVPAFEGEVHLKVKEDYSSPLKGNIVVPVEIYIDGKFVKIEPVSLIVTVISDCFMTERVVNKNEQVAEADIKKIRMNISNMPSDLITDMNYFTGKVTKRAILRGTLLAGSMFEKTPLFKRGSAVKVILKVKALTVETQGIAEDSGTEGKVISVRLASGKILEGTVDASGQVIIQK